MHLSPQLTSTLCIVFNDLRAHSTVISLPGATLLTSIQFQMDETRTTVMMTKLYLYLSDHLVITHQAEIMPDFSRPQEELDLLNTQNVCCSLLSQTDRIFRSCCELGPLFLFSQLIDESMKKESPVFEFVSRSLYYFKSTLSVKLYPNERIMLIKNVHIIEAAVKMLQTFHSKNHRAVTHFIEKQTLSMTLAPYAEDLLENLSFSQDCVRSIAEETLHIRSALDTLNSMRSNNASMTLSLIGTIFLPITFFAGVFGMNFTVDGGYTMNMINDPNGPLYFYAMCTGVCVLSLAYFISQGWLEPHFIFNFLNRLCGYTSERQREAEQKKALEEERRRVEDSKSARERAMTDSHMRMSHSQSLYSLSSSPPSLFIPNKQSSSSSSSSTSTYSSSPGQNSSSIPNPSFSSSHKPHPVPISRHIT